MSVNGPGTGGKGQGIRGLEALSPLAAFLLYALLALLTTHPLWLHLASAVPGDIGDPLLNAWIIAWDTHAILTNPFHLFHANIYFPLPNTLAYSEHLVSTAALILPIEAASGEPVLAYNASLLLSFPLAGLGMYLLVLQWTRQRGAALVAGLAFAFVPYRLAAIAHLQLLTVQWLPFSLLALERVFKSQRAGRRAQRYWVLLVVFVTLQVLASWYLAVFTGLVLGLYGVGWLLLGRKEEEVAHAPRSALHALRSTLHAPGVFRLALAALLVAALTLPFALPYLKVLPQLQAARPAAVAASFAAHPPDFLAAPSYLRVAGPLTRSLRERPGFTEENTLFLGIVTPLLALAGLALGRPRWRAATSGVILISSLALTFAGPYLALIRLLPALTVVRVPPRWIIPATFALAVLAGLGVAGGRKAVPGFLIIPVTCLLMFVESFAAPLPLAAVGSRADVPPVYRALQQEALGGTDGWGVVELPMHVAPAPEFPETKRMLASTLGWWGLVNGYSGFTPARQMALGQALAGFPDEASLATLRDLAASGVRYLLVHPDETPLDRSAWETVGRWQAARSPILLPAGRFGPDDLYRINPYAGELITNPAAISDPYWSALAPAPLNARFIEPASGAEIWLLAYSQSPYLSPRGTYQPSTPPAPTSLHLYWRASAPLETSYTVFVHGLNAEGQLIGQADGPPVGGHYPTHLWRPGEIVQDSRPIPPGEEYRVGLYDLASGQRLPAFATDGTRLPDDAVVLAPPQP